MRNAGQQLPEDLVGRSASHWKRTLVRTSLPPHLTVAVREAGEQLPEELPRLLFRQPPMLRDVAVQWPAGRMLRHHRHVIVGEERLRIHNATSSHKMYL